MKTLILCEGKTDAIILSYFLSKKYNWKHVSNREMNKSKYKDIIRFQINENQSCCLYENGEKLLLIYACGGIEEIPKKINEVADINSQSDFEKRFNKIIVMTDKDENELNELEIKFNEWIKKSKIELNEKLEIGNWILTKTKQNIIGETKFFEAKMLFLVLPKEGTGNLEVFLLEALRETGIEEVIEEAKKYIENVKETPTISNKTRKITKAKLQAVFSVLSPEWVFSELDERLLSVEWEKLEEVNKMYKNFNKL